MTAVQTSREPSGTIGQPTIYHAKFGCRQRAVSISRADSVLIRPDMSQPTPKIVAQITPLGSRRWSIFHHHSYRRCNPHNGKLQIRQIAQQLQSTDNDAPQWIQLQRRIFAEMEKWLENVTLNSWLDDNEIAEMVAQAIVHRHYENLWNVLSIVIMPNQLHLLCDIPSGQLKRSLETFKRWTGHRAMQMLNLSNKRFWQRDWFDHWSRSDEQDERILKYIESNPSNAGLSQRFSRWPYYASTGLDSSYLSPSE